MPVYMIRAGVDGPVKIGFTTDLHKRLVGIQNGCAQPLLVLRYFDGDASAEARLHQMFKKHRMRGEWFSFTPEMLGDVGISDAPIPAKPVPKDYTRWSAESRAKQSRRQIESFADPVKGAQRRERFRQTRLARVVIYDMRDLVKRAGGWTRCAEALGLRVETIHGWQSVPRVHAQAMSDAARMPVEKFSHLLGAA